MNTYRLLADAIVVLHFAWVAFVVVGLALILLGVALQWRWVRNFWFRAIHLLMIGIVVVEALGGVTCPLTTWEREWRELGGEEGQRGSFVGRLINRLLFYDLPDLVFRVLHCVFGAAVAATFIFAPPRWPCRKNAAKLQ
jgi:MFS superfamily sulfate permease-like transporter